MKRAICVVDLGFGDSAKGATVDFICRNEGISLVVKASGGSQCAHTVVTSDGRSHTFAQWGAGTFAGVRTYLGPRFIIDPVAMHREADHLKSVGVEDPWNILAVNLDCLMSTRYHRLSNQIAELMRGNNRHGSCGHGIGETRAYWLNYGRESLVLADTREKNILISKLRLLQARLIDKVSRSEINNPSEESLILIDRLINDDPEEVAEEIWECSSRIWVQRDYPLMPPDGTVVYEGSHGILLDEYFGFPPHHTWSTTTSKHAFELIPEETPITTIGCIRSCMTRHGEGPLPTYSAKLTEDLQDPGNPENPWQGSLRCGWLDLPLIKYAIEANGGVDGLAVSHLDQRPDLMCTGYPGDQVLKVNPIPNLVRQEKIGSVLSRVQTRQLHITEIPSEDEFLARLNLIAPVMVVGRGRTAEDRVFTDRWRT